MRVLNMLAPRGLMMDTLYIHMYCKKGHVTHLRGVVVVGDVEDNWGALCLQVLRSEVS